VGQAIEMPNLCHGSVSTLRVQGPCRFLLVRVFECVLSLDVFQSELCISIGTLLTTKLLIAINRIMNVRSGSAVYQPVNNYMLSGMRLLPVGSICDNLATTLQCRCNRTKSKKQNGWYCTVGSHLKFVKILPRLPKTLGLCMIPGLLGGKPDLDEMRVLYSTDVQTELVQYIHTIQS
jgi:hypothetical protein